jgi:hypothetical protein
MLHHTDWGLAAVSSEPQQHDRSYGEARPPRHFRKVLVDGDRHTAVLRVSDHERRDRSGLQHPRQLLHNDVEVVEVPAEHSRDSRVRMARGYEPAWSKRTAEDDPGAPFFSDTTKYVVSATLTTATWRNSK